MFSPAVDNLVAQLTRLPGVGQRTAQRLAFHILRASTEEALALADDTLTLEFPGSASFHLKLAEEPKNAGLLRDALFEVTGRKLRLEFVTGENGHTEPEEEQPATEEDLVALVKETFDAREVNE